jgi:hypothetical protein
MKTIKTTAISNLEFCDEMCAELRFDDNMLISFKINNFETIVKFEKKIVNDKHDEVFEIYSYMNKNKGIDHITLRYYIDNNCNVLVSGATYPNDFIGGSKLKPVKI